MATGNNLGYYNTINDGDPNKAFITRQAELAGFTVKQVDELLDGKVDRINKDEFRKFEDKVKEADLDAWPLVCDWFKTKQIPIDF